MTQVTDPAAMREIFREDTGQFGLQPHAESGVVELWDPRDGSYAFPPIPKTAADVIGFWKQVEIPDDALETMVHCSQEAADEAVNRETDKVLNTQPALRARIETGSPTRADQADWESLLVDAEIAARNNAPLPIPRAYARTVVRIASMAHWASFLDDPQARKVVLETPIFVPGAKITNPETIWKAYNFDAFYEKATERQTESEKADSLRAMADSLRILQENSDTDSDLRFQKAQRYLATKK